MGLLAALQRHLPRRKLDIFEHDSLINTCIPYYLLPAITLAGLMTPNPEPFVFIIIIYTVLPLLDEIFSLDERNPSDSERRKLQRNDVFFRMALYTTMILDWAAFFKTLNYFKTYTFNIFTVGPLVATIFTFMNLNAAQFAIAHEIMHKPGKFYRCLATAHMFKLGYMHFTHHHLYNHHFKVATPEDPSSAQKGDNVYSFFIQCVKGSWQGVYKQEQKQGKSLLTNYATLSLLATLCLLVLITLAFGVKAMCIHSLVIVGSIFYLEAINYIEHYGLQRKQSSDGSYEKISIQHSWNAPHRFTNYLLFKLQRHSDHHENSSKPYQTLESLEVSPLLPHGYTLMITMSFFPKYFRHVMDPLVDQCNRKDNPGISPAAKETAIVQARKFIILLGLLTVGLYVCAGMLAR